MKHLTAALAALCLVSVLAFPAPVAAAKKRVRTAAPAKTGTAKPAVTGTGYSTAKLSRATNSVIITFLNLDKVQRVDYVLSYAARGIQQGAGGAVVPAGQSTDSRDLYFGTCSKGVCTPHGGISGATLTITATLKSGGIHTKRYRIKI